MFIKELFKTAGFELNVYNLIADYTLPDGRRAHNAFQVFGNRNQVGAADDALIAQVQRQIPKGSRLCMIAEIEGDYELSELSKLADSVKLLFVNKRMIYLDYELARKYVDEIKKENCDD